MPPADTIPRMSRALTTVRQVWQEYTDGINGGPSIQSLERQGWRRDGRERMYYSRRNCIYRHINARLQCGEGEEAILADLEARCAGKSLHWLQNVLQHQA
jgi:hypothetical protein